MKKGDNISVEYTGMLEDGTVFDTNVHNDHSHPLEFEVGSGQLIQGFDKGVIGMKLNEEKTIKIPANEAYGDPNPDMIKPFPRDKLPKDVKEGSMLVMQASNGQQIPVKIAKLTEKEAMIDLNHPLAGKTLTFKIKVIGIKEA